MKCVAAVVISMNAMVGVMQLQAGEESSEQGLPQGHVSVEYVPTIQVEAKRLEADEVVAEQAELMPRFSDWVASVVAWSPGQLFAR